MGARTDEAERRVAAQRERIERMLGALEDQVQKDIEDARAGVDARATLIGDQIRGHIPAIPDTQVIETQVEQHPLTALLGGFGVGVVLGGVASGIALPSFEVSAREHDSNEAHGDGRGTSRPPYQAHGFAMPHVLGILGETALSAIAAPLRTEVQTMLRETIAGFLGNAQRSSRTDHAARPDATPVTAVGRSAA